MMTHDVPAHDRRTGLTYDQALDFWFRRVNYEQRIPKPNDLSLERMRTLMDRLGNPQQRLRIIHVAGSKGKGSTSAMLASILRQASYRTGLFTSPHLCRVEERVQVDGQPITPAELTALVTDIAAVTEYPGGLTLGLPGPASRSAAYPLVPSPTFFEVATALGFLHFVRRRAEVAVIEVGLGGRFDSTNVCLPEVSIITSISLDHTRQLGNRLASIAMEKAGIIKPGRPAISGATVPEAREVIEAICRERHSSLRQLEVDFRYAYQPNCVAEVKGENGQDNLSVLERPRVQIFTDRRAWPLMELGLLGEHQAANAAVAVASVEQLRGQGWHIPDSAVMEGLAHVSWPARLEIMGRRPFIVLDCAHNVASAQALVKTLETSFPPSRRLLVFASSNDKDVPGIFRTLAPHFAHAYLTRYGTQSRSVPPQELAEMLGRCANLPCTPFLSAPEALQAARSAAKRDGLICITGSVFLAGALRPLLLSR